MNRKRAIYSTALALLSAWSVSATTYYIDWDSGDDTNNGTSTNTPWKRHPDMQGFAGGGFTAQPGDRFILKGGVTWPNSALCLWLNDNGTAENPIYIGIDTNWYSGDQWVVWTNGWGNLKTNFTYPKLDAQGTNITDTRNAFYTTRNCPIVASGDYLILDGIEVTGHTIPNVTGGKNSGLYVYSTASVIVSNLYVHDWVVTTATSGSDVGGLYVGGLTTYSAAYHSRIWGPTEIDPAYITEPGGTSMGAGIESFGYAFDCDIQRVVQGLWNVTLADYCVVYNGGDPTTTNTHGNGVNMYGTKTLRNSLIRDWRGGTCIYPVPGWTNPDGLSVVYNNIVSNSSAICITVSGTGMVDGETQIFNNTLYRDGSTIRTGAGAAGVTWRIYNNLSIGTITGDGITDDSSGGTVLKGSNVVMTVAAATSAGIIDDWFEPASEVTEIYNQGTDLSTYFASDRLGVPRPQDSVWDVGAYEFVTGGVEGPEAPVIDSAGAVRWLASGTLSVPITGTNYDLLIGGRINDTTASVSVNNNISAVVSVSAGLPVGSHTVVVSNSVGTATNTFTVLPPPSGFISP